jgi:hypothetical protein
LDRLKHIIVIASLFIYNQATLAQNKYSISELNAIDKKINESIFISTNTNTFLTGENLLYKLFCLNNSSNAVSTFSKIAYIELVDSNKKSIFTQKLFLEKGIASGDFFIPTTLETGNYKLVGYTSWMLNKSNPDYFSIDISIINPYQTPTKNITNTTQENNITDTKKASIETTNNFSVVTNKKIFSNREVVNFNIKPNTTNESLKGNFSVSVRKLDTFSSKNKLNINEFIASKKATNIESNYNLEHFIIPELRGEIISGKIISKSGTNNIENKNISLSIPGKNYAFEITKTNKKGEFIFNLEKSFPSANIIIQIIESDKENYKIEINKVPSPNYSSLTFNEFQLNPELQNLIEEKAVASQIENAYYENKKDSLIPIKDAKTFYDPLSTEYILNDYTRFPTLKETVIEVVEGMYFKTENKIYSLHLRDFDLNNKLDIPALVIVDGLIIQDINELFAHKADLFYKISLIKGGYYFGSKLYNGLISFTTKQYDYDSKLSGDFIIKPEILRPLGEKKYFQPNYSNNNANRIPDYRYQLLWLPEIKLENKEQTISFLTSDVTGEFEILLEGISDNGKPIYVSEIIEVK